MTSNNTDPASRTNDRTGFNEKVKSRPNTRRRDRRTRNADDRRLTAGCR
jgi:hypothetical protein